MLTKRIKKLFKELKLSLNQDPKIRKKEIWWVVFVSVITTGTWIFAYFYIIPQIPQFAISQMDAHPDVLFKVIILFLILFVSLYFFLGNKSKGWFERKQVFFVVITLLASLMIFVFQQFYNSYKEHMTRWEDFNQMDVGLQFENSRNLKTLENLNQDFSRDQGTIFIGSALIHNYNVYLSFIQRGLPLECQDKYYQLMTLFDALNDYHQMKRNAPIETIRNNINIEMLQMASGTKVLLEETMKNCDPQLTIPKWFAPFIGKDAGQ